MKAHSIESAVSAMNVTLNIRSVVVEHLFFLGRRARYALSGSRLRYMVKPHGQLVLVSSTPHSASTPNLSTS